MEEQLALVAAANLYYIIIIIYINQERMAIDNHYNDYNDTIVVIGTSKCTSI